MRPPPARTALCLQAMMLLSQSEQVVLASLLLESRFTKGAQCDLRTVAARAAALLHMKPKPPPATARALPPAASACLQAGALLAAAKRLGASRLVHVWHARAVWSQQLALAVPVDDVLHVLQESPKIAWMRSMLGAATPDAS
jgi:hypothetical protein